MPGVRETPRASVERRRRQLFRLLDRDELVAFPDAHEDRAAERRHDTREIEPISHRLLSDREVPEVRVLVREVGG